MKMEPGKVLAWVFTLFAVIPFGIWTYHQVSHDEAHALETWPMLIVTVVFGALAIGFFGGKGSKLYDSVSGLVVGVAQTRTGMAVPPPQDDDEEEELQDNAP